MKNAKKILACLLALMLVLALAACGEKECSHADSNNDHKCDACGTVLSECADTDKDHKCDACGTVLSECADTDKDHKCDTCGAELSQCADADNDHKCDICGTELSQCADADSDHKCDTCGAELSQCTDADNDHKCDTCGTVLSECADANNDRVCDACGKLLGLTLTGSADVIDPNTQSSQYTLAQLELDLVNNTATLDIVMPIEGIGNMYFLSSAAGTDPTTSWLWMMATIVGEGTVTEADGGYLVSFAWTTDYLDETTGETVTYPMSLEIPVTLADGVYTASINYQDYIVMEADSIINLTGAAEVIDPNTASAQYTIANLDLNLINKTATLDIVMPIEGVGNMYFLSSAAGTDPTTSWMWMMATIVGEGTITEADGGYLVSFAWSTDYLDETTGETVTYPMSLEISVALADGVYTANINYQDYIVIDVTN